MIITEVTEGVTISMMKNIGYEFIVGLEEKQWNKGFRNAVFRYRED